MSEIAVPEEEEELTLATVPAALPSSAASDVPQAVGHATTECNAHGKEDAPSAPADSQEVGDEVTRPSSLPEGARLDVESCLAAAACSTPTSSEAITIVVPEGVKEDRLARFVYANEVWSVEIPHGMQAGERLSVTLDRRNLLYQRAMEALLWNDNSKPQDRWVPEFDAINESDGGLVT